MTDGAQALPEATVRVRMLYDRMAGRYDRLITVPERWLFAGGRAWACAHARGEVLEIGVGTGRNFAYFPDGLRLSGVELSTRMLDLARDRARSLGAEVDLREGDAQQLEWSDESFDTVISTLTLCSIPDERRAVAEAWRVLRPGGRLVLLEHVRSPVRVVRIGQEVVEPLFLWAAGDHLLREPLHTVACQGFVVDNLERAKLGIVERLLAHKPD